MSMVQEFKKFIMRGNLVELAIAFIIGAVFAALVKAFISDLITPIIALIVGKPNFANLSFTINSSHFLYGDFINYLITFVVTAAVVFFFIFKPYDTLMTRLATEDLSIKECPECTLNIPQAATRCPECTAQLGPATPTPSGMPSVA
jgi:large conductance mechanosensitive channel